MTPPDLPSNIYLDSSVVVAAIIGGDPHSVACKQYCADLAANNSAIYFAQLLRLEVAHVVRRIAATNVVPLHLQQEYQLSQFNTNFMIRQQWMRFGIGEFETLLRTFYVVYELPYRRQIWRQALEMMSLYNLKSYDAAHVATALRAGLHDFATVDGDYSRVSGLQIHIIR